MRLSRVASPRPSRGARIGLVLGGALALLGIAVGGTVATSSTNPFVYVANPASSPVPVSVTNQPTTQNVSGTVSVSNFPTTQDVHVTNSSIAVAQPVARAVYVTGVAVDATANHTFEFGQTIDVRSIIMDGEGNSDTFSIDLQSPLTPDGAAFYTADGTFKLDFPVAIPATGIEVVCGNSIEKCDGFLTVIGQ